MDKRAVDAHLRYAHGDWWPDPAEVALEGARESESIGLIRRRLSDIESSVVAETGRAWPEFVQLIVGQIAHALRSGLAQERAREVSRPMRRDVRSLGLGEREEIAGLVMAGSLAQLRERLASRELELIEGSTVALLWKAIWLRISRVVERWATEEAPRLDYALWITTPADPSSAAAASMELSRLLAHPDRRVARALLMTGLGFSQQEIAGQIGVSQSSVSRWISCAVNSERG